MWREEAAAFGEVSYDVLGSSWVRVPGTREGPLLAIVGHIDEIALVVTHAGDDGLIAVRQLGGFDAHVLLGQRLDVLAREGPIPAVVGARKQKRKRGEERKPLEFDDLYLDIGAKNGEEVRSVVRVGDAAVIAGAPIDLRNNRIASRALDNRLGSYVALEVARRVAEEGGAPGDVAGLAVVQEEVGDFAGARTTVFALEPTVALAVDVTGATDIPDGDPKIDGEAKLGGGPIVNRGSTINPKVFELLVETAEAEGIRYTVNVSAGDTHTDMDAAYTSRAGIATGLISLATRYIHTPGEVVSLDDVEATVQLVAAFAQRLEPGLDFTR